MNTIKISNIKSRINLLNSRDPIGNLRIINKLKRQLRRMGETV